MNAITPTDLFDRLGDPARIRQIAALPAGDRGVQGPQSMGLAGHSTSGVQLMPQSSNATGGNQFNVDLSSFSFPVEPSRQRCQSVQWCIVWGLLAFLWIISTLRGLGLRPSVSDSNFVFFGHLEDASDVWRRLLDRGVLVRDVGIPHHLRVTAGTEAETTAFLTALAEVLGETGDRS